MIHKPTVLLFTQQCVQGDLHKILAQHFLPREARDSCSLIVPLIHESASIDTKDRRVRSVYKGLQLLRYASLLDFDLLPLCDVLTDTDHADNCSTHIPASRGVEQHLNALSILGVERKLEIGSLAAFKSIIQHLLDADLVLLRDEILRLQ